MTTSTSTGPSIDETAVPIEVPEVEGAKTYVPPVAGQKNLSWIHLSMDHLLRRGDLRGFFRKCEEMNQRGIGPSNETYRYLFQAYKATRQFNRAYRALERMAQHNVTEQLGHYHAVMEIATHMRYAHGVHKVYDLMRRHNITPTATTFNLLVQALCLDDQVELAYRVWNIMHARHTHLTEVTANLLIKALVDAGALNEAFQLLQSHEEIFAAIPVETYSHVFRAAGQHPFPNVLQHCWKKLVDVFRVKPTHGDCLLAMRTAALYGRPDLASDVIRIMNNCGYPISEPYLDCLFTAFVKRGDWRSALNVLHLMREAGIAVDAWTLAPMYRRLRHETRLLPEVTDAITELKLESKAPFLAVLNLVLALRVQDGNPRDAVPFMRQFPTQFGLQPDHDSYQAILTGCDKARDITLAEQLFAEMQATPELAPQSKAYTAMIVLHAHSTDYERIFVLLEELKAKNMIPSATAYHAILGACLHARDSRAKIVVQEMDMFGYSVPRNMLAALRSMKGSPY
ncbi:hypothetical protein IWQ60_007826 [Tieghemiomyces parasiticus]|uniref:Pentacotripeptide-repeat region of PRORP domain-containing protein n=1 Tax=Tieghemiomyces parasiticus TaxID=78921 RepID=A0A9W7ZV90_9FUNG|nr:hypothetical protein IWQ60_007826 [Tieghemiomyces parasiticus]